MKEKKLQDALGMIGEDLYDEENLKIRRPKHRKIKWAAIIAAALCISIIATVVMLPGKDPIFESIKETQKHELNIADPNDSDILYLYNGSLAMAVYPKSPDNPNVADKNGMPLNDTSEEWYSFYREMDSEFKALDIDIEKFYQNTCRVFFKNCENKNLLYSPVNLYMALAMLAEISGGESRAQLLSLTDCENIEELRQNAKAIWKACYKDDGVSSLILANSLWLDDDYNYNQLTLELLAEYYYASSFSGESGSGEFNETLRKWLNDQTGGILEDNVKDIEILPDTVLTLASTIYFYAKWSEEFNTELTENDIFHSPDGEQSCDFMHSSDSGNYFWGDNFSAVKKQLNENGTMYFILPDQGATPEELLSDGEIYDFLNAGDYWTDQEHLMINMSVPKFDVSSKTDLKEPLMELGVKDIFEDGASNFENLTEETSGYAASVVHSVRVNIDEEGCEAAAYTVIPMCGSSAAPTEEVDFVLDRPFIFVITSDAGIPLYTGIVNNP